MPIDWDTDPVGVVAFIEDEVRKTAIETAEVLWDEVIRLSPVYTGRYRASWDMTVGSPSYKYVDHGGSPEAPLPPPKMPKISGRARFPVIYLTNGSPYAERIEYGWSGQAPYGVAILATASV